LIEERLTRSVSGAFFAVHNISQIGRSVRAR
jgi:hypothetical protein